MSTSRSYVPKRGVAERYGVSTRSVDRWRNDPSVGFPAPAMQINERCYWAAEDLDAFDAECVRRRLSRNENTKTEAA
jgi:hypothetical protein